MIDARRMESRDSRRIVWSGPVRPSRSRLGRYRYGEAPAHGGLSRYPGAALWGSSARPVRCVVRRVEILEA